MDDAIKAVLNFLARIFFQIIPYFILLIASSL